MDLANTDEQCYGRPNGSGKSNGETESAFHPSQMQPRPHSLRGMLHKPFLFGIFASESLHNPDCAEHLLHNGKGGAVVGLCFARAAAQSPTIDLGDHIKDGRNEEGDQSQLPIDSRSDVKHSGERQARFDERNQVIDGDRLDRSRIGLHAIERVHGALGVVIGQRQALNLTEKFRSESEQKFFAGIRLKHRYGQILQLRQDGYDDQQFNEGESFMRFHNLCGIRYSPPTELAFLSRLAVR